MVARGQSLTVAVDRCLDTSQDVAPESLSNQQGLDKIFNRTYLDNYQLLMRIATNITGISDISEELCQEALLKYYQKISFLPHGIEARYWLIRVVKNLALNYAKRKMREYAANRSYYHNNEHYSRHRGEVELLENESAQMVRQAVLKLPDKLRNVLLLKEYGSLSYAEIAKTLNISMDNVKVRVFRAREKLSSLLEKEAVYVP